MASGTHSAAAGTRAGAAAAADAPVVAIEAAAAALLAPAPPPRAARAVPAHSAFYLRGIPSWDRGDDPGDGAARGPARAEDWDVTRLRALGAALDEHIGRFIERVLRERVAEIRAVYRQAFASVTESVMRAVTAEAKFSCPVQFQLLVFEHLAHTLAAGEHPEFAAVDAPRTAVVGAAAARLARVLKRVAVETATRDLAARGVDVRDARWGDRDWSALVSW